MLFKLLKHNLQPILKSILPFIISLFVSVILFNLTDYTPEYIYGTLADGTSGVVDIIEASGLQQFFHGLFNFTATCSMILLLAAAIRAIWHQFKTSFYSDRAYLTHTLPIARRTLWNTEFCSILITFVCVIIVLTLNFLLLSLTRGGQQLLESFGLISGCSHCVGDYYYIEPLSLGFYLSFALIVLTEFTFLTLCGITGIVIKHRLNKNLAIIFGLALYFLGSIILLGIFLLIGKFFDQEIFDVFNGAPIRTPDYNPDLSFMTRILLYLSSIYFCYCAILYFVDHKLLQRGIDLD